MCAGCMHVAHDLHACSLNTLHIRRRAVGPVDVQTDWHQAHLRAAQALAHSDAERRLWGHLHGEPHLLQPAVMMWQEDSCTVGARLTSCPAKSRLRGRTMLVPMSFAASMCELGTATQVLYLVALLHLPMAGMLPQPDRP